jgi:glucose/arabinose dehydrogenase
VLLIAGGKNLRCAQMLEMKNVFIGRMLQLVIGIAGISALSISLTGRVQAPATPPAPAVAPLNDLKVPAGFRVSVFASDLPGVRMMTVSPEGVLLVARRRANEVVALPDKNGDGRAEPQVLLSDLANAHGLAFKDGYLYISTTAAVMRVRWAGGKPAGGTETFVDLPTSTPSVHVTRSIAFGRDGRLYIGIGSSCNVCVEPDSRRTTIQVVDADGSNLRPFARGMHNAIGFDWDPATGRMWAGDTGQDGLGDGVPPEEINLVEAGKHYGFPFFIAQNQANHVPELKDAKPDVTAGTAVAPVLELPAHTTPMDLRFYTGAQFPAAYRNALFLALHGSSTIPTKVGYKVVRVVMKDGKPVGTEDFMTGWLKNGEVSGRPAGLATGPDGALYVSDDNKGFIYRVSYGH